jgi:hypothetical protein
MYDHDMFGLSEAGSRNQYLIGSAVGVAASTGVAIGVRKLVQSASVKKYANGIGAASAGVIGGAMMFSHKTKEIGLATIVSGVAAGLLAHLTEMIAPPAAAAGLGYSYSFGDPVIDPAYPIPGSVHGAFGGFGAARPELVGPPTLVGAGDYGMSENPGATQTKLLGGPSISALGAHYGATLFGR